MVYIRPETFTSPLKIGDEVQTVAASSEVIDEESLSDGLDVLKSWGLICRSHNVCKRHWGYLAGDDKTRFLDLHPQKTAELIVFAKGGWGSARLLEKPQPWKKGWMLGFSDASSLLLARISAGFDGGIHGPMLTSLAEEPSWSKERLHAILFGKSVPDIYGEGWNNGIGVGPLIVTNLTIGSHLLGSRHIPDLKGSILILEDIGEEPYRIERMLTHWRLVGLLQQLAGIGFGRFQDCEAPKEHLDGHYFELQEVLQERSSDLGIPVVGELPIGHCCGNASLPIGRKALIDGKKGILRILP